jgi:hypothetical protein
MLRFNGWWIVLALLPYLLLSFLPSMRRTSGSTDPLIHALHWSFIAIGMRAVIGIIRQERSWTWAVYLVLFPALLLVADQIPRSAAGLMRT